MIFQTNLTHKEVMRVSLRAGQLIRLLHGKPGLIIGIARGGVPPAEAFAKGAGTESVQALLFQRPSSSGAKGDLRRLWTRYMPGLIRQIYKRVLFKLVVSLTDAFTADRVAPDDIKEQIATFLADRDPGPIVVIDDAIDSGGTILAVVNVIEEMEPGAEVIVYSLATTLGRIVYKTQYTLVSGHIAHFVEGDLAYVYENGEAIEAVRNESNIYFAPLDQPLEMYFDLDGTLTKDSFRDAVKSLSKLYLKQFALLDSLSLMTIRLMKKARLINHTTLKKDLDKRINKLEEKWKVTYFGDLAVRLRLHSRPALSAMAQAPNIRAAIVTAALDAYRPAVEIAFGLPVISGSKIDENGKWLEIGSTEKVAAIEKNRSTENLDQAILVGDTLTDALSLADDINVIAVPTWDSTGLSTMLGIVSWLINRPQVVINIGEKNRTEAQA